MCCLKYEESAYEDLVKKAPKIDAFVDTPSGKGSVVNVNLLRGNAKVRLEDGVDTTLKTFTFDELDILGGKGRRAEYIAAKAEGKLEEAGFTVAPQQEQNMNFGAARPTSREGRPPATPSAQRNGARHDPRPMADTTRRKHGSPTADRLQRDDRPQRDERFNKDGGRNTRPLRPQPFGAANTPAETDSPAGTNAPNSGETPRSGNAPYNGVGKKPYANRRRKGGRGKQD
jgi:hypothetical protein